MLLVTSLVLVLPTPHSWVLGGGALTESRAGSSMLLGLSTLCSSGLRSWWKGVVFTHFLGCGNRALLEDDPEDGGTTGEPR